MESGIFASLVSERTQCALILSYHSIPIVKKNIKIKLYKIKQVSAFSFQIGKSWNLDDVKSVEMIDVGSVYN